MNEQQAIANPIKRAKLYIGLRKNLFDLRPTAVVHNLHVWARLVEQATAKQYSV